MRRLLSFFRAHGSATRATLVALGVFGAGTWAQFYTPEILHSKLFILTRPDAPWCVESNLLWLFVSLTFGALFFHEYDADAQRNATAALQQALADQQKRLSDQQNAAATQQRELLQQQALIPELIRTLPPEEFLRGFNVAVEKMLVLLQVSEDRKPVENIQALLAALADLASLYDNGQPDQPGLDAHYGANVVVYCPGTCPHGWLGSFDEDVGARQGTLLLSRFLSATNKQRIDPDVAELALPIPEKIGKSKASGGAGWRVLPGAPFAFIQKQFDFVENTAQLRQWFEAEGEFYDDTIRAVLEYFDAPGTRSRIRGFFSVPILRPTAQFVDHKDREAIGVLNVHWNTAGRFRSSHAARLFANATYPLAAGIALQLVHALANGPPARQG